MGRLIIRAWILIQLAGVLVAGLAAPPVIGTATAQGRFLTDHMAVRGNATLFDGTVVETSAAASTLRLQGGPQMQLGPTSRGRVYRDRLVLEKGNGQMEGALRYRIEARDLRILPNSAGATARVALREAGRITVAALGGPVRVTTADGTLLAALERGTTLEFQAQGASAAAPVVISGCLARTGDLFLLRDDTANVSFEVKGKDLEQYAGERVSITATVLEGVHAGEGASQVVQVAQIKRLPGGCPLPAVTQAAQKSGMAGSTKAIIAGVVIAAAAGGSAIGLTGEEEQSSISR